MMFSLDKISKTKLVTILNHIVPYSSMHSSKIPYKYKLYLNDISKHIFNFINEGRSLLLGHLKNTSQVKSGHYKTCNKGLICVGSSSHGVE